MDTLARHNARRFNINAAAFSSRDWALAVNRLTERVHNAAKQTFANRNVNDFAETLNCVALFNAAVITKDNNTNIICFEVQGHALNAARKLDHLAGADIVQAVDTGDTITNGQNLSNVGNFSFFTEALNLLLEDRGDLCGANVHNLCPLMFL